jgi:lysozyme
VIAHFEGTVLTAYYDVAHVQTVCTGHVVLPADKSWMDDGVTMEECLQVMQQDVRRFERVLNGSVRPEVKLSQEMVNALISLAYNIGEAAFASSTVVKRLNAGDLVGAADAFLMWRYARVRLKDGTYEKRPVLLSRRESERQLFLSGVAATVDTFDHDLQTIASLAQEQAYQFFRNNLFDYRDPENDEYEDEEGRLVCLPPDREETQVQVT